MNHFFSMIGAYCYAELGILIKSSGGDYSYILYTFGPFVGFVRLWAECAVVRPCTITIVALTFSTYACKPFFPECEPPDEAIRALAALCICKSLLHIILRIKNLYKVAFNFLWCSFDFRIILSMYLLQVPKRFEPVQIF